MNVKGTLFLMQALAPRMAPGSAIVNLASAAGKTAHMIEQVDYSAAKAAVIAMTKAFAIAFAGNGVRVNCVCPGMTDTPLHRSVRASLSDLLGVTEAEIDEQRVASVPMARKADPEEVAAVVCFLLSEDASYMTGQAVNVTGRPCHVLRPARPSLAPGLQASRGPNKLTWSAAGTFVQQAGISIRTVERVDTESIARGLLLAAGLEPTPDEIEALAGSYGAIRATLDGLYFGETAEGRAWHGLHRRSRSQPLRLLESRMTYGSQRRNARVPRRRPPT